MDGRLCGGGIISHYHVLSAAHCFINADSNLFEETSYTVTVGVVNLNTISDDRIGVGVQKIYVPRTYNPADLWSARGDIAVLWVIAVFGNENFFGSNLTARGNRQ